MSQEITMAGALILFRSKIESVKKTENNPFFKSKYADLSSILEAIKQPLSDAGLAMYHQLTHTTTGESVLRTTLALRGSQETITSEFPVFGGKPQEIGSSMTYARRYNINALLDIPTEDDDGNAANKAEKTKAVAIKPEFNEKNPKWNDGIKKMIDENLDPSYFDNFFYVSPDTKSKLLKIKMNALTHEDIDKESFNQQ